MKFLLHDSFFKNLSTVQIYLTPLCPWSFPGGSVVKNPPANAGDTGETASIPGREAPLEEETAAHSSIPAWETPWTEEPRRLYSMGSQTVGHSSARTKTHVLRTGSDGKFHVICFFLTTITHLHFYAKGAWTPPRSKSPQYPFFPQTGATITCCCHPQAPWDP